MKTFLTKHLAYIVITILFTLVVAGQVPAQTYEAALIQDCSYQTTIFCELEDINKPTTISFTGMATIELNLWDNGIGFYGAVGTVFAGIYLAPEAYQWEVADRYDQDIRTYYRNVLLLMTGISTDQLIIGTGLIILDFEDSFPMTFMGYADSCL
ncbi:MAG: hypothetical protein GY868_13815 [Deltaproteobacteria bacterium]|nr:hypothetical protein [Deltaproteobacteria bacterium]